MDGYSGDGFSCSDIDECVEDLDNCDANADCVNNQGSFSCECHSGFSGNGTSCLNVNECEENLHNCHVNAECTDSQGSFNCSCSDGYDGDGKTCIDIDECTDNIDNCHRQGSAIWFQKILDFVCVSLKSQYQIPDFPKNPDLRY